MILSVYLLAVEIMLVYTRLWDLKISAAHPILVKSLTKIAGGGKGARERPPTSFCTNRAYNYAGG